MRSFPRCQTHGGIVRQYPEQVRSFAIQRGIHMIYEGTRIITAGKCVIILRTNGHKHQRNVCQYPKNK